MHKRDPKRSLIHTHKHTNTHTHTHITHVQVSQRMRRRDPTCSLLHTHTHTYIHASRFLNACVGVIQHVAYYTYTHTYTHTHTNISHLQVPQRMRRRDPTCSLLTAALPPRGNRHGLAMHAPTLATSAQHLTHNTASPAPTQLPLRRAKRPADDTVPEGAVQS
jgi:hypothetical protein